MVDKVVELENNKSYVILDETIMDDKKYYYGLRLGENEEPTNNYLFFESFEKNNDTFLIPINDKNMKGLLLTAFTINFLDKVYDDVE